MEKYNKYMKFIVPATAVIFFGVGYFGHSIINPAPQAPAFDGQARRQFGQGQGGQVVRGGGMTQGEVLSVDDTGITVKGRDGGSKIIIMSTSTKIFKSVDTAKSDLKQGTNVMVAGTANPDGSISASSVSVRNDLQFASTTKQ